MLIRASGSRRSVGGALAAVLLGFAAAQVGLSEAQAQARAPQEAAPERPAAPGREVPPTTERAPGRVRRATEPVPAAPVPLESPHATEPPISERPPTRNTALYHGNYCGTGDNGPGLPPIDELDAVCMRHDQCYDEASRASCACDRALAADALAIANASRFSIEIRRKAASVAEAAQLMRCSSP